MAEAQQVELISTPKRNSLRSSQFALPSLRKYPIHDAAHTRNAAVRLEQNKSRMTPAQYAQAKSRIAAAARKFGIDSEYNKKDGAARKHLRMRLGADGGVEIHHSMSGDKADVLLVCSHKLADLDGEKPVWNQIAVVGEWRGHKNGPFRLTNESLNEIKANFDKTENHEFPIDFEHATEADPNKGNIAIRGAPAQGWVKELKISGGRLFGLVDWLPEARELINEKKYKYLSPAIRFGTKDRVTGQYAGARITSAALTNNPFLDGMMPLAARDFDAEPLTAEEQESGWVLLPIDEPVTCADRPLLAYQQHEFLPQLRAALKANDLATASDMMGSCHKLRELYDQANDAHAVVEGVQLSPYTSALRDVVRLPLSASVHDILDAVEDLLETLLPPGEDGDKDEPEEQLADAPIVPMAATDAVSASDTQTTPAPGQAAAAEQVTQETAVVASNQEDPMDTIPLTEHTEKVTALTNQIAELGLQLKDANSKAETAEASLKELRDAEAERKTKQDAARVEAAFNQYKGSRKLKDEDKEAMALVLSNKPELFEKLYPPQAAGAADRLLTDRITPTEKKPRPATAHPVEADFQRKLKDSTEKYQREGKTYDEAWDLSYRDLTHTTTLAE